MLDYFLDVLALALSIFGLMVAVFFHEMGHFLGAKLTGIGAPIFSVGFGRPLWKKRIGETEYRVTPFLFGGYVAILGQTAGRENDELLKQLREERGAQAVKSLENPSRWLCNASLRSKLLVLFAGPLFSILLTVPLLAAVFYFDGVAEVKGPTTVVEVLPGSPAERGGLRAGDGILSISGFKAKNPERVAGLVAASLGKPVSLEVQRGGDVISIKVMPEVLNKDAKDVQIGVTLQSPAIEIRPVGAFGALKAATVETGSIAMGSVRGIYMLFTGQIPLKVMSGPVGIVKAGAEHAQNGFMSFVFFVAVLSTSLGIFNLLPIPPLDGGRMGLAFLQKIKWFQRHQGLEYAVLYTGAVAAVVFFVFVTAQDIAGMR